MPESRVNIDVALINFQTTLCLIYFAIGKTLSSAMEVLNFVRLCDRLFSQSPSKFRDGLPSLRLHNPPRFLSGFPFVDFGIVLYLQGKIFIRMSGYSCVWLLLSTNSSASGKTYFSECTNAYQCEV